MKNRIDTHINIPPQVSCRFNKFLLLPWVARLLSIKYLLEKANKKIRSIDTGRRKQFDEIITKVMDEYEQYKKENPEQAKICEKEAERCYNQSKKHIVKYNQ